MTTTFSNGTEYEKWSAAWCKTCVHDRAYREAVGDGHDALGCELIVAGMSGEPVEEWRRGPLWSPQTVVYCTRYEPETVDASGSRRATHHENGGINPDLGTALALLEGP